MPTRSRRQQNFYDQLAPYYHLKVDWDKRLPREVALFDQLIADPAISAVCDLGCGDGGHAGEIVKRGALYYGIDSSAQMIAMARRRWDKKPGYHFLQGDMLKLPKRFRGMFDIVLLLGNTLPHLLTQAELRQLLRSVRMLLMPQGRFVIQTVNPELLAGRQIHFLPPKLAEAQVLFTPFYVRKGDCWDFLMPIYTFEQGKIVSHLAPATQLRFWQESDIVRAAAGKFRVKHRYGDARLSPYRKRQSENLLLILEKV